MLTKAPHLFDDATQVTAGDSCWQGKTSPDYWAFVGPFGGCTAATILRALIDHPQRAGDPLSLTVNFCAPVAQGPFDLDVPSRWPHQTGCDLRKGRFAGAVGAQEAEQLAPLHGQLDPS